MSLKVPGAQSFSPRQNRTQSFLHRYLPLRLSRRAVNFNQFFDHTVEQLGLLGIGGLIIYLFAVAAAYNQAAVFQLPQMV